MCVYSRPSGLKYEKAKEWRIPCVNAQWLCDILLGNFEALRQIQHSRYTQFNLAEPLAPNTHLVQNLLGKKKSVKTVWSSSLLHHSPLKFLKRILSHASKTKYLIMWSYDESVTIWQPSWSVYMCCKAFISVFMLPYCRFLHFVIVYVTPTAVTV